MLYLCRRNENFDSTYIQSSLQNGLCGGIGIKSNKIAETGCVKKLTHSIYLHIRLCRKISLKTKT